MSENFLTEKSDLNNLSDAVLIFNIKNDKSVSECLKILTSRHDKLFYKIVRLSFNKMNGNKLYIKNMVEEIFGSVESQIYSCCNMFDENRDIKFSSFLGLRTRYDCLNFIHKNKKISFLNCEELNFKNVIYESFFDKKKIEEKKILEILEIINNINDDRAKKIFELRFFSSKNNKLMPWREICKHIYKADGTNFTSQACMDIYKRHLNRIKNIIKERY